MNAPPRDRHRVLPHDLDAEQSILGGILIRNEVLARLPDLEVADFYDPKHKIVFQAIRNLEVAGCPIDVVTLEHEIAKAGKLEAIGGVAYLGELTLRVPTADNVVAYANIVRLEQKHRLAQIALGEALRRLQSGVYDSASEGILETIGELQRIFDDRPEPAESPARARWCVPLTDFLGDEEPDDDDSQDWIIRDMIPRGEAALLAGPPKCGKTWSMLGLGIDAALGLSWLDTFDNTMTRPARVLCLAFEDGQRRLRKRVWELARARRLTPNDPTLRAHLSISREPLSLPGDERAFAAELKAWKPDLVLIDNLTRVMAGDQNAIKDAKRFSDVWCKLCSDVGAAVVFLHHTSKIGPIRPDKRGEGDPFELIRGSGDLVASARHLVLFRPLESPDAAKLSDVRMRGNLDLRREDFVLGFERAQVADRWTAQLFHRGDSEAVHDELAAKRREKQAARKEARAATRGEEMTSSVDERVFRNIAQMCADGARELCTYEHLKQTSGVRAGEVRPSLDRLVHAGRVRTDQLKRFEGSGWRKRIVFVPTDGGSS